MTYTKISQVSQNSRWGEGGGGGVESEVVE